jgi:hypothetical protein
MCELDAFSKLFFELYPGDEMVSEEALAVLHALASIMQIDNILIEDLNARIRRSTKISAQTHKRNASIVSADFMAHASRKRNARRRGNRKIKETASNPKPRQPPKHKKPRKGRRGGGAWRAFVRLKTLGTGKAANFKELARLYKTMSEEDRRLCIFMGKRATAAMKIKVGGPGSNFGFRTFFANTTNKWIFSFMDYFNVIF